MRRRRALRESPCCCRSKPASNYRWRCSGRTTSTGPTGVKVAMATSGAGFLSTLGICRMRACSAAVPAFGSAAPEICAVRSTRRSEKSLLLPTKVRRWPGISLVVTKRPTSSTVPVPPPAEMKSPTLNGRRITRKIPAARSPAVRPRPSRSPGPRPPAVPRNWWSAHRNS